MRKSDTYHVPVLLKETVDLLNVRLGKKYIDATLGGGGHSEEIVKRGGILLGIDQDPEAISYANERLKACPGMYQTVHPPALHQTVQGPGQPPPKLVGGNFAKIDEIARENGFAKVEGILFDLGVSSHQLEIPERGFSFNQEGPLDMRMNPSLTVTAKDLINGLTEEELNELFSKLGEEKHSRRFARAICRARQIGPIVTGNELAEIILKNVPPGGKFGRTHPATRVFQALRIAVNDELNNLKEALPKTINLLNQGGRLVVLSFHSLEDGIVKRFFLEEGEKGFFKIITKKPVLPAEAEIGLNPRARSGKLRAAEKL